MTVTRKIARSLALSVAAGAGAVVWAAAPAAAHTGAPSDGVLAGVLHPLTGPDHLLAMVCVGVVAALAAPGRARWAVPAAFVGGMLAGGVAGVADVPLPGGEGIIVASVLCLGVVIAAALDGRAAWLLAAVAVAGAAHGHAHGAEAPASADPAAYIAGFVAATAVLHLLGAGVGAAIRERRTVQLGIGAATVAAGALLAV